MNQDEELARISSWLDEQGLGPGATADEQLCFLWRALQHCQRTLTSLSKTLEQQRSKHAADILEVRKSLEQIRVFTGHKDVLAQEIQDENDQLRTQLQRLLSQQDARVSEVARMLYDQGLTELVHSSPSEQVAYLLVERASLLDAPQGLDGAHPQQPRTGVQVGAADTGQTHHKRAVHHSQSPWRRLLGLHKNQKYLLVPAESRLLSGQAGGVQKECHRLERDLEEGSKRLATAHNEIRRLTDELEGAHSIQRAYGPELEAAKQEVEELRQEVEQVKKYEIVGLRKAKELNDRLNEEIQCLRSRREPRQQEAQKQLRTVRVQTDVSSELEEILFLQTEMGKLQSALQEEQCRAEEAAELNKSLEADGVRTNEVCNHLQSNLKMQIKLLSERESEIEALKLELETCQKERSREKEIRPDVSSVGNQLSQTQVNQDSFALKAALNQDHSDSHCRRDECKFLKRELCETLKYLNQERRKYHEMKERLKLRLVQAKQKLERETGWRDEKMETFERELCLCSFALTKEKELTTTITMENDKLLVERKRLLQQQLNEELNKKNSHTAFQCRIEDLEMENRKLQLKILDLSAQVFSMEGSLQDLQCLRAAGVVKDCDQKLLAPLPAHIVWCGVRIHHTPRTSCNPNSKSRRT